MHPHWIYLSGFISVGLTFAGLTDLCPMAELLAKLPWNVATHCPLGISRQEKSRAAQ